MLDYIFISSYKAVSFISPWASKERAAAILAAALFFNILTVSILFFDYLEFAPIMIPTIIVYVILLFKYSEDKIAKIDIKYKNVRPLYSFIYWLVSIVVGCYVGYLYQTGGL